MLYPLSYDAEASGGFEPPTVRLRCNRPLHRRRRRRGASAAMGLVGEQAMRLSTARSAGFLGSDPRRAGPAGPAPRYARTAAGFEPASTRCEVSAFLHHQRTGVPGEHSERRWPRRALSMSTMQRRPSPPGTGAPRWRAAQFFQSSRGALRPARRLADLKRPPRHRCQAHRLVPSERAPRLPSFTRSGDPGLPSGRSRTVASAERAIKNPPERGSGGSVHDGSSAKLVQPSPLLRAAPTRANGMTPFSDGWTEDAAHQSVSASRDHSAKARLIVSPPHDVNGGERVCLRRFSDAACAQ